MYIGQVRAAITAEQVLSKSAFGIYDNDWDCTMESSRAMYHQKICRYISSPLEVFSMLTRMSQSKVSQGSHLV